MSETKIDRDTMGRLAKALNFICGSGNETSAALKLASETGTDADIKKARTLFLRLKSGDRASALSMLSGD
jgi:hypothetical protein